MKDLILNIENIYFYFLKIRYFQKNTSYKLIKEVKPLTIDLTLYKNDTIFTDYDIDNLEYIINISNKIRQNKNKFYIKDKNVIKLDNNFYANVKLGRFFLSKINDSLFKYNSIILNYNSFKNKLLAILSIYNANKVNNNFTNIEESTNSFTNESTNEFTKESIKNLIKDYINNSIQNAH